MSFHHLKKVAGATETSYYSFLKPVSTFQQFRFFCHVSRELKTTIKRFLNVNLFQYKGPTCPIFSGICCVIYRASNILEIDDPLHYLHVKYSTVQSKTMQCNEVQHSTTQRNPIQPNTILFSAVQFSTR